ncbi:MAG TPA: hypothetical protein VFM08_15620 [Nocardioides sp.]|jgi:hypothetical protein|nr:hypothetical protein [Nocardioides sp.]
MSILNIPHRVTPVAHRTDLSAGTSRWSHLLRLPGEMLVRLTVALWTALWMTAVRAVVLVARLAGWFAAEPGRIRAALLGVSVSVMAGAVAGLVVGLVLSRALGVTVAFIHQELVTGP